MIDKRQLLEDLKRIYNSELNTETIKDGIFESSLKIISIDIIYKNNYYGVNNVASNFDKIYIKNQKSEKGTYIYIPNIVSYEIGNDRIVFYLEEDKISEVLFGFKLE